MVIFYSYNHPLIMVIIHCKLLPEGMNDPDPIVDQRVAVPSVELLIQLAGKSTEVRIRHI